MDVPYLGEAVEIYLTVSAAEASSNLARYDGIRYGKKEDGGHISNIMKNSRSGGFGDEVKRRILGELEGRVRVELLDEAPDGGAMFVLEAIT